MADIAHRLTDQTLDELEDKVRKAYEQASKEAQAKTNKYFSRFKVKDAKKQAEVQAGLITESEYKRWRHGQMCVGKRWQELTLNLTQDYHNANLIARHMIGEDMLDVYALNHNWAGYEIEHATGIDLSWTLYNRRAVENLIRDNPKLLPDPSPKKAQEIAENKDLQWNYDHIQNALTQGVLQGEPIPDIANRLTQVTNMDISSAIRNARTMMTCAENKARQDAYDDLKERGVVLREKWISTLDSRTRHSHQLLHGTYKDPETGEYDNGLQYPGDPDGDPEEVYNCRCCEIAEVDHIEIETPKYSPKMKGMSFDEWLNWRGSPDQVEWYRKKYG